MDRRERLRLARVRAGLETSGGQLTTKGEAAAEDRYHGTWDEDRYDVAKHGYDPGDDDERA